MSSLASGADSADNQPDGRSTGDATSFILLVVVVLFIFMLAAFLVGILLGRGCTRHVRNETRALEMTSVGVQCDEMRQTPAPTATMICRVPREIVVTAHGTAYHQVGCSYLQRSPNVKRYAPCARCLDSLPDRSQVASSSTEHERPTQPEPDHEDRIVVQQNETVRRRVVYRRQLRHNDPTAEPEAELV